PHRRLCAECFPARLFPALRWLQAEWPWQGRGCFRSEGLHRNQDHSAAGDSAAPAWLAAQPGAGWIHSKCTNLEVPRMKTTVRNATIALLLMLPQVSVAQPDNAAVFPDLVDFADSLASCEAATASQPHPLMPSFTIEHSVVGMRENEGRCEYRQSMPGNMQMICAFDPVMLDLFADEVEQTGRTGEMSGSTQSLPAWMAACELETPDGKRTPLVAN